MLAAGRLGESEAQDLFRGHTGEQQTNHALHQHMRLAGAGIGDTKRTQPDQMPDLCVTDGRGNGA